jgi:excisionase family DNA binding protein
MPDEFLTVMEIAEQFKLNPQTIRNWISQGDLPAVRVGARRVRVRRADFDKFLEFSEQSQERGEPESASGGDLDETGVAAWAELGIALSDASAALSDRDMQRLTSALDAVSAAAQALSAALNGNAGE